MMSTLASRPAPPAPGDEELAALYNQVLIGFAEESPTTEASSQRLPSPAEYEPRSHYTNSISSTITNTTTASNRYSDNTIDSQRSSHQTPARTPSQMAHAVGLPSSPRGLPMSPTQGRLRPLPQIPGQPPPLPPPPPPPSMYSPPPSLPEPRPYYPDSYQDAHVKPKHPSGESGGRRLPQTPTDSISNGYTNGAPQPPPHAYPSRYPYSGLPSDPRPGSRQSPESHRHDSGSPVSMPVPHTNGAIANDYNWRPSSSQSSLYSGNGSVSVTRQPSTMPNGAQAPRIPGYDHRYEEQVNTPDSIDDMYADVEPAPPAPAVAVRPPPPLPPPGAAETLQPGYRNGDPAGRSYSPAQPAQGGSLYAPPYSSLNRSQSNVSTVSAHQQPPNVHRNLSAAPTTTSTQSSLTYSDDVPPHSASTPATSLDRGDSYSSYVSRGDEKESWTPQATYKPLTPPGSGTGGGPLHHHQHQYGSPPAAYESAPLPPPPISYQTSVDAGAGPSHHAPSAAQPSAAATIHAQPLAGSSGRTPRRDHDLLKALEDIKKPLVEDHEDYEEGEDYFDEDDPSEEGDDRFFNPALLSHIAVRLKDKVPRGTHVKGNIPYPRAFTGKDIVSTIQTQIQRELLITHGISTSDRRAALQVARSLQSQLFFYEVEWGGRVLQDGVEDVYMFLDDIEGASDSRFEQEELPTGVITLLTKCYSSSCDDENPCYSFACPRRREAMGAIPAVEEDKDEEKDEWKATVPPEILQTLPQSEINRQSIIHKVISKEKQYLHDLDTVESLFIRSLRMANPPVIRPSEIDDFIDDVFGNILDLRECNKRLLETMYVRQREQSPIIHGIGDIFLNAATEFRLAYPNYVGHYPLAEKRMKDELEHNNEFRRFLEQCARHPDARHLDLKHFLSRPAEHLQKYPITLEAIMNETTEGNPDTDFLKEAIEAIKKLQTVAQLWTFQAAMGKGPSGQLQWHNLVSEEFRKGLPKKEAKRQNILFELIKGEMDYVKDLENIEVMYVAPLREMDPPIISRDRLPQFIQDVFHNFGELHAHHRKLLNNLHEIQREEHPVINSVTAAMYDAVLNFREAYVEYIPNYPIAAYRIDDEMANNPQFKAFVEQCTRHPDAHRLDMKNFINRPIPRLLRYELLLKNILDETEDGHEDLDTIPSVLEAIKALGKETEPGVVSAKQKVEVWRYNSNLVFKQGEAIDMDLLNENRSLIHVGKLLRQPDTGFEWNSWTELFVLLFDNYLVMTKPKEKDGITKYHVYRRPIPLDLLTLANFTDPPTQRSLGILKKSFKPSADPSAGPGAAGSPDAVTDSRLVFPCTIHHNGRLGGLYTVFADQLQTRTEWKQKLDEAIGLRKVVQESNKVFEVETLSADTFLVPSIASGQGGQAWNHEHAFTGKVTCSVPFTTADGRGLVAIGCAEGVWIGFRHDSRSMRRVLHLKMVTQCAMLEDFGIFLVLADKSLFAYHIEALVPSSPQSAHTSQTPQKLSGNKDVHFFSVGNLNNRTLVIYMKKKGLDSVFRVLEPVLGKINERSKAPQTFGSRLGLRSQRSDWFRIYRDFFLPSESFDLIFLKAKIVILCTKGFEIMDLIDFKSVTIPQRDEPRLEKLSKRLESCRPMGMFRSSKDEFLLCYDEFGLYVDRHGDPTRSAQAIEWEGTAEHVAWHPPYVLLFDSRFIEIRHVETGRLAQIIPGNDVRCIWDGQGPQVNSMNTPGVDGWSEGVSQEPRVHGVMNAPEAIPVPGAPRNARPTAQHVFELIPTIPLYLPGSLSSPSQSTYFAQSNSPPHSPTLNPALSWR